MSDKGLDHGRLDLDDRGEKIIATFFFEARVDKMDAVNIPYYRLSFCNKS